MSAPVRAWAAGVLGALAVFLAGFDAALLCVARGEGAVQAAGLVHPAAFSAACPPPVDRPMTIIVRPPAQRRT